MLKKILFLLLILLTFGKIPAFSDEGPESVTFTDNSESVVRATDDVTFKDPIIQKFVNKNRTLLKRAYYRCGSK
ncbi:hypothetical protein [Sebaldella sp. S0638]|uniref:hypothetical protein n=1 Tax=Sebaldella sp. S0638 TaxID=2957809 RepID=UPI0020A105E6|nr:hypothetical protein [Sebaldella sp. S0638]MCP1225279.1 hypothetical protein [Sebaldella sp. S0638]